MRQFELIFQKSLEIRILKSNVIEILKIYVIEKLNIQKTIDISKHTSPKKCHKMRVKLRLCFTKCQVHILQIDMCIL